MVLIDNKGAFIIIDDEGDENQNILDEENLNKHFYHITELIKQKIQKLNEKM